MLLIQSSFLHLKPTQAELSGAAVDVVWAYLAFDSKKNEHNGV